MLEKVLLSGRLGASVFGICPVNVFYRHEPTRISQDCKVLGYDLKKNDWVFFMFGAANREPAFFVAHEIFDVSQ